MQICTRGLGAACLVLLTLSACGGSDEEGATSAAPATTAGGEYCEDPAAGATYRWKATDEELTLTPIDNDCPDRQTVLTGTWTRD